MTNLTIRRASALLILAALSATAACTTPGHTGSGQVSGPYVGTGGGYGPH